MFLFKKHTGKKKETKRSKRSKTAKGERWKGQAKRPGRRLDLRNLIVSYCFSVYPRRIPLSLFCLPTHPTTPLFLSSRMSSRSKGGKAITIIQLPAPSSQPSLPFLASLFLFLSFPSLSSLFFFFFSCRVAFSTSAFHCSIISLIPNPTAFERSMSPISLLLSHLVLVSITFHLVLASNTFHLLPPPLHNRVSNQLLYHYTIIPLCHYLPPSANINTRTPEH